jgi:gliding motility-associated-like protein
MALFTSQKGLTPKATYAYKAWAYLCLLISTILLVAFDTIGNTYIPKSQSPTYFAPGDFDDDGISDIDEGLNCTPIYNQSTLTTNNPTRCTSGIDTNTYIRVYPNSAGFGGTCDGPWTSTMVVTFNDLVPGIPATYRVSSSHGSCGNQKPMTATLTGPNGFTRTTRCGGSINQGYGTWIPTFTPTSTSATFTIQISIPGPNNQTGGDIWVNIDAPQQTIYPQPPHSAPPGASTCTSIDTDSDGIPDYQDLDSDNDGILDSDETNADTDGEGIGNWRDLDADNDGIADLIESGLDANAFDPDLNGVIDGPQFADADDDGLAETLETGYGPNQSITPSSTDPDTIPNYLDLDSDDDGLPDALEGVATFQFQTNDGNVSDNDTDADGIIDLRDPNDTSTGDFGGLFILPIDTDNDGTPDYIDLDSDNDTHLDQDEGGSTISQVSYQNPNGNLSNLLNDLPDEIPNDNEVGFREQCQPQIDSGTDFLGCDAYYVLPNLTTRGNYYDGNQGQGNAYFAGDTITQDIRLYIYKAGPRPNCYSQNEFNISFNRFTQNGQLGPDQSLCSGTTPQTLTASTPTIAEGSLTYQWQESSNGTDFSDITGATASDYAPTSPFTTERWFRRVDTSTKQGLACTQTTNPIHISIIDLQVAQFGGPIDLCVGETPPELTPLQAAQGSDTLTFQWQQSSDGTNFSDIVGVTTPTYLPPLLNDNTWFRRMDTATDNGESCSAPTNAIRIRINRIEPGHITGDQLLCAGTTPNTLSPDAMATATGTLGFQWEDSLNGTDFTAIPNADGAHYDPQDFSGIKYFRRIASSDLDGKICYAISNTVTVSYQEPINLPEAVISPFSCEPGENTPAGTIISLDLTQVTGGNGNYPIVEFIWDNNTPENTLDDVSLQVGPSNTYTSTSQEDQTLLIRVQDELGCWGQTQVNVSGVTPLTATAVITHELCKGFNDGSIALSIEGGTPPYRTGLNSNNATDFIENQTLFEGLVGGQQYMVYVRDAKNCETVVIADLNMPVNLIAEPEISYRCDTGSGVTLNQVHFQVDPSLLDRTLFILNGDYESASLDPVFNNLAPGNYQLTMAHDNGCIMDGPSFEIQAFGDLALSLDTQTLNTIIAVASGGNPPYQYRMENGEYQDQAQFPITQTGTYTLWVRDTNGCEVAASIYKEFLPVEIPNFFTPNGDNSNQIWKPTNLELFPEARTHIYDRYGRLLKILIDPEGWDGIYEGERMPSGDYWYLLQIRKDAIVLDPIIGNFTLYR